MLVAKLPGSMYATEATNAGPRYHQASRRDVVDALAVDSSWPIATPPEAPVETWPGRLGKSVGAEESVILTMLNYRYKLRLTSKRVNRLLRIVGKNLRERFPLCYS